MVSTWFIHFSIEQAANEMLTVFHRLGTTDKALQKVTADLQTIGARCGSQGVDIQNLYQELKNFDSKLEGVLRSEVSLIRLINNIVKSFRRLKTIYSAHRYGRLRQKSVVTTHRTTRLSRTLLSWQIQ